MGRDEKKEDDECVYTLGQHTAYLQLSSEVVAQSGNRYWFCDWTPNFASLSHQNRLLEHVVKEYCHPFLQHDLEDTFVGFSALSSNKRDPPAVRTVTIQLRPDCDHIKVFQSLNEAFAVLHPKHHVVLKNSDNCFQAIGADGNVPLLLSAQIVTSKDRSRLDRYVLLRFFHADQVTLFEEQLKKIGGVQHQKSALKEVQTPLNNKLGEACAMLQKVALACANFGNYVFSYTGLYQLQPGLRGLCCKTVTHRAEQGLECSGKDQKSGKGSGRFSKVLEGFMTSRC